MYCTSCTKQQYQPASSQAKCFLLKKIAAGKFSSTVLPASSSPNKVFVLQASKLSISAAFITSCFSFCKVLMARDSVSRVQTLSRRVLKLNPDQSMGSGTNGKDLISCIGKSSKRNGYFTVRLTVRVDRPPTPPPLQSAFHDFFWGVNTGVFWSGPRGMIPFPPDNRISVFYNFPYLVKKEKCKFIS